MNARRCPVIPLVAAAFLLSPVPAHPGGQGEATPAAGAGRIARSYTLRVKVEDLPEALRALSRMAEDAGGDGAEVEQQALPDGRPAAKVRVRPSREKAAGLLTAVTGLGEVAGREERSEDMSGRIADLSARLRNARTLEGRLLALLGGRATGLPEVLAAEEALSRARAEAESLEEQLRYLEKEAPETLVAVELSESPRLLPSAHALREPLRTVLGKSLEVLVLSTRYAVIAVAGSIPWAILLLAALFLRKRRAARKDRGKPDQSDASASSISPSTEESA